MPKTLGLRHSRAKSALEAVNDRKILLVCLEDFPLHLLPISPSLHDLDLVFVFLVVARRDRILVVLRSSDVLKPIEDGLVAVGQEQLGDPMWAE